MVAEWDPARIALSTDPSGSESSPTPAVERPFRILVMGDFSCREWRTDPPGPPPGERRPVAVASPDELLAELAPVVDLELDGPGPVRVRLSELADFHPDRLARALPHLRDLLASIDRAVEERGSPSAAPEATGAPAREDADPPVGILDEIVADSPTADDTSRARSMADLQAWIRDVVDPHLVQDEPEAGAGLRSALEREAAARVVEVLHAPGFRAAEALWRGLLFLMSRVADPDVRIHVLDLSRGELETDLGRADLSESPVARTLLEPLPTPGDGAAALMVAAWDFGGAPSDIVLLNRLAMVAHAAGAPLVTAARPGLLGLSTFADAPSPSRWPEPPAAWRAFRATEAAGAVGMAAPGFLLRVPYGETSDPCRVLPVNEMETTADAPWLWGNAALPCAVSMARAFLEEGWRLSVGPRVLSGLPFHVEPDGSVAARSVEAVWPDDVIEAVAERGVMPLGGHRREARLRVPSIFSTRSPRTRLKAWWNPH